MNLYIKHMVSNRCKMVVEEELKKLGLQVENVDLGRAEIRGTISVKQRRQLQENLKKTKLELMEDKQTLLVEKIKELVDDMIRHEEGLPKIKFSMYLSEKLCHNYTFLSNTFSENTGITIETYIIRKKIERVKELLLTDDLNLTQISYQLQYSSVAHLSNQFKKVTGISPTQFKKIKAGDHRELELQS